MQTGLTQRTFGGNMATRISSKKKSSMVISLIRGESIEEVARLNNVTVADLVSWRDKFISGGERSFKRNENDNKFAEYERAIGKLQLENELLKKKTAFKFKK
jgi:transposase-like protein